MKKVISAILLLFNLSCAIERTLPMELLNTWDSADTVILQPKRYVLFVCLQEFNPQSNFVDKYIASHYHPDVWHIVPTNLLDELTIFTKTTILNANNGMIDKANLKFARTYDKQDINGKNPNYTNACFNLYDSQELIQEIARILDQIYLDDAMFPKEYQKRYKDTMQKYRKHYK